MYTIIAAVLAAVLLATAVGDGLNAGGPSAPIAAPADVQPPPATDGLNAGGPS